MDFRHKFGANLRQIRERLDVSQESLGYISHVHRTQVGRYERGEVEPGAESLVRMSLALGIEAQRLFAGMRLSNGFPAQLLFDDADPEDQDGTPPAIAAKRRLGLNIRRARERIGLSQEEVAERSQMNYLQVSGFEQGKTIPQVDALIKLANVLKTTPTALCRGVHWDVDASRWAVEGPKR